MAFIRKVKTGSGAIAVQIIHKAHGQIIKLEHLGSAHHQTNLEALIALAKQRLRGNQLSLLPEFASPLRIRLKQSVSQLLYDSLLGLYDQLGFLS